jgi:hypothetical protein
MGSGDHAARISLAAAARVWGVSRAAAYRWHSSGRVKCFRAGARGLEATAAEIRAEKVLSAGALLSDHRIDNKVLDFAVQSSLVSALDGRFSLADRDALLQLAERSRVPGQERAPPRFSSVIALRPFHWTVDDERTWVAAGADPAMLPDAYWATPAPPRFIPPANVFLYTRGDAIRRAVPPAHFVRRSEGYELQGDVLVWCPATEEHERLVDGQAMPAAWMEASHRYLVGAEQWLREWHRRQARFSSA